MPKSSRAQRANKGLHVMAFGVTKLGVVLVPYPPNSEESQLLRSCCLPWLPLGLCHFACKGNLGSLSLYVGGEAMVSELLASSQQQQHQ